MKEFLIICLVSNLSITLVYLVEKLDKLGKWHSGDTRGVLQRIVFGLPWYIITLIFVSIYRINTTPHQRRQYVYNKIDQITEQNEVEKAQEISK